LSSCGINYGWSRSPLTSLMNNSLSRPREIIRKMDNIILIFLPTSLRHPSHRWREKFCSTFCVFYLFTYSYARVNPPLAHSHALVTLLPPFLPAIMKLLKESEQRTETTFTLQHDVKCAPPFLLPFLQLELPLFRLLPSSSPSSPACSR
jgi:hypothetical protein